MNPLVEQMLVAQHRNDLESEILELALAEDCKCQSSHRLQKTCTHEVVALKTTLCGAHFLICAASYAYNLGWLQNGVFDCSGCGNLASECWTIRPI